MSQWQMKRTSLGQTSEEVFHFGIKTFGLGIYGIGLSQTEVTLFPKDWQDPNTIEHVAKTKVAWASEEQEVRHMEKTKVNWQEKVE